MSDATAPRVAPGGRRDVGLVMWAFAIGAGKAQRTNPPNLFLTLGRHRRLFRGWLRFAGRLMPFGALPRRETELVILRVAHLRGCAYEWEHHRHLGRRAGVTSADLVWIEAGPDASGWSERERVILTAVDELHADGDLSDASWASLREHLDERQAIELVMLVGHYEMLATTIGTLRIQPDRRRGGQAGGRG
jgi:AhpD family alkylhydroperoxidase